jgi:hypothetical protein
MTPNDSNAPSTLCLEEEGFICSCTASSLDDGAWVGTVSFERDERPDGKPPLDPPSHKVPGVFLDSESALSAAAAYAMRTIRWQRV